MQLYPVKSKLLCVYFVTLKDRCSHAILSCSPDYYCKACTYSARRQARHACSHVENHQMQHVPERYFDLQGQSVVAEAQDVLESPFSLFTSVVPTEENVLEENDQTSASAEIEAYYPPAADLVLPPVKVRQPRPPPPQKPQIRSLESLIMENGQDMPQSAHRRAFSHTPAGLEVHPFPS